MSNLRWRLSSLFPGLFLPGVVALTLSALSACSPDPVEPGDRADTSSVPAQPPNVLLIMIDTLRADYLSFHGFDQETAPFLAGLAARSTVFRNTLSTSSWTAPATASLFTGLVPTRHGLMQGFHAQRKQEGPGTLSLHPLPPDSKTLPEHLQEAGYRTSGVVTNINIGPELGFDRGFDPERFRRLKHERSPAPAVLDLVRQWAEQIQETDPWFLYLHFMDVHEPWHEREPWYQAPGGNTRIEHERAMYLSELSYLDQALREFFEEELLDLENTVVWFLSDHGEEFKDHGKQGHGFTLYQELTGVLNMVHAPGLGVPAQQVDTNVSLVDVLPTLLEWTGREVPAHVDGQSLLPFLQDRMDPTSLDQWDQRVVFAHRQKRGSTEELGAAVTGRFKLIKDKDTGEWHLFDLAEDPKETSNLYRADHPAVKKLAPRVEQLLVSTATTPPVSISLTEEQLDEIKSLGYVSGDQHRDEKESPD